MVGNFRHRLVRPYVNISNSNNNNVSSSKNNNISNSNYKNNIYINTPSHRRLSGLGFEPLVGTVGSTSPWLAMATGMGRWDGCDTTGGGIQEPRARNPGGVGLM